MEERKSVDVGMQSREQQGRLFDKLRRELGPFIIKALLDEPDITEIMVNSDGRIWIEKRRKASSDENEGKNQKIMTSDRVPVEEENSSVGLIDSGYTISPSQLTIALGTIASMNDKEINEEKPLLDAVLPIDGSRVWGGIPPATPLGPSLVIRKHSSAVFPLQKYVEEGRIPQECADYVRKCIKECKNIVVAGGTSSGKTTFINSLIRELLIIAPQDRIIVMEDTFEIKCETTNKERLVTTEKTSMQSLVRASLRMRPDRIIVGEVRGKESLDLLKAWITGHPGGLASLHANDAMSCLTRLEGLNMEATGNSPQSRLIGDAVNLIVHMDNIGKKGRQVREILKVNGFNGTNYDTEMIYNLLH